MDKNRRGFQKTTIGVLAGLILMIFMLIMPVSADPGEMAAWGNDWCGQATAQSGNDYVQVS
ncbi:MAG: hypothetical protein GX097_03395, partial [Methanomicrobiales archaeon]|nr:hypothetical protein [Methanomicrobiales archaeon]